MPVRSCSEQPPLVTAEDADELNSKIDQLAREHPSIYVIRRGGTANGVILGEKIRPKVSTLSKYLFENNIKYELV